MHERIDWEAAERSPEFQELVHRRRRFVVPATVFFLVWYLGFILLAGYAPDFMGESVYEGLTVGYVLALTQFLMVWGLGWLYLRKADREFEPLERKAAERAGGMEHIAPTGRFQRRTPAPATTTVDEASR
jgi:uncharacterized membrane protein (DUF485 family)